MLHFNHFIMTHGHDGPVLFTLETKFFICQRRLIEPLGGATHLPTIVYVVCLHMALLMPEVGGSDPSTESYSSFHMQTDEYDAYGPL